MLRNPERTQEDSFVHQFFASKFTQIVPEGHEYLYKLSIALAEIHFESDFFDGLIYPAMALLGNADNLVIKPQSVDTKLTLKKVEYYQIIDCSVNSGYQIKMLDFANSFTSEGKIEWKERLPQWTLQKKGDWLKLTAENGKWVARNSRGEIVEPE